MAKIDWSQMKTPEQTAAEQWAADEQRPVTRAQLRRVWRELGKSDDEIDALLAQN